MAKKAFSKSKAEMKKQEDSLAAIGSFMTEDDDTDEAAADTVTEKTVEDTPAETKKPEAAKRPAKKTVTKKEPEAEDKTEGQAKPAAEEKKPVSKMVDVKNIPGSVYMPPLTSRSSDDKFTCIYQLRMTADTDKNIRKLAKDVQRSYNYVVNMILEAYFDAVNESK